MLKVKWTLHCVRMVTSLGTQESWDTGQVLGRAAVSPTVQGLWDHLSLEKPGLVEAICAAGPPVASCFEAVWDVDIEGILGPDKMLEQMHSRSRR